MEKISEEDLKFMDAIDKKTSHSTTEGALNTFKRLKRLGLMYYKSDMFAGWWEVTEKGKKLIK